MSGHQLREIDPNLNFAWPDLSEGTGEEVRDSGWLFDNSSFSDYAGNANFKRYDGGLLGIIRRQIGLNKENIGVDIAGGHKGRAISDLIHRGVIGKGMVTNYYNDYPWPIYSGDVDFISGNILRVGTWKEIIKWQRSKAPDGIDLVLHRPVGGLQDLPTEMYIGATHALLDIMKPGGVMFTQMPRTITGGYRGWGHRNDKDGARKLRSAIMERDDVGRLVLSKQDDENTDPDRGDIYTVIVKTPVAPRTFDKPPKMVAKEEGSDPEYKRFIDIFLST